jgi:transposase
MLTPTGWWLAVAPIDLRCGIDRLLVLIAATLGQAPTKNGVRFTYRKQARHAAGGAPDEWPRSGGSWFR